MAAGDATSGSGARARALPPTRRVLERGKTPCCTALQRPTPHHSEEVLWEKHSSFRSTDSVSVGTAGVWVKYHLFLLLSISADCPLQIDDDGDEWIPPPIEFAEDAMYSLGSRS